MSMNKDFLTGNFQKTKLWHALFGVALLPISSSAASGKYSTRVQAEAKGGNKRALVRPSMLVPIHQTNDSLLHLSLMGLADSKKALEGNIGVGFRNMVDNNILGAFAFYDIRKSQRGNTIHQATLGAEWFREYLEFRANFYLPQNKLFNIDSAKQVHYNKHSAGNRVDITTGVAKQQEKALAGFDIDVGTQIPGLEDLTARLAYYRFGASDSHIESRNGIRGVLGYQLADFLQLDAEASYDNQRKLTYFAGVTLGYNFGSNVPYSSLSRLEQKMTSIPIRDIDIVTGEGIQQQNIDIASVYDLEEDTTIVIANEHTGELVVLDLQNGNLRKLISKIDNEDMAVSSKIDEMYGTNVITDPKTIVLYIDDSGRINNINEYTSAGKVSGGNQYSTVDMQQKFINLVNVYAKSSRDLSLVSNSSTTGIVVDETSDDINIEAEFNKKEIANNKNIVIVNDKITKKQIMLSELNSEKNKLEQDAKEATQEGDKLALEITDLQNKISNAMERLAENKASRNQVRKTDPETLAKLRIDKLPIEKEITELQKSLSSQQSLLKSNKKLQSTISAKISKQEKLMVIEEKKIAADNKDLSKYQHTAGILAAEREKIAAANQLAKQEEGFSAYHKRQTKKFRGASVAVTDAESAYIKAQQNIAQAKTELESANTSFNRAEIAYNKAREEESRLNAIVSEKQKNLADYKKETNPGFFGSRTAEQTAQIKRLEAEINAAKNNVQAHVSNDLKLAISEKTRLSKLLSAANKNVNADSKKLELATKVFDDSKQQLEHYRVKVASQQETYEKNLAASQLRDGKDKKHVRNIDKLEASVEKYNAIKQSLETINSSKSEVESLIRQSLIDIARKKEDILSGQDTAKQLASEVADAKRAHTVLKNRLPKSSKMTEEQTQQLTAAAELLKSAEAKASEHQIHLKALESELKVLSKQESAHKTQLDKHIKTQKNLQKSFDAAAKNMQHYTDKLAELDKSHEKELSAAENIANMIAAGFSKAHRFAASKLSDVQDSLEVATAELADLTEAARKDREAMEQSLSNAVETLDKATTETMQNAVQSAENAVVRQKKIVDNLNKNVNKLNKTIDVESNKLAAKQAKQQVKDAAKQAKQQVKDAAAAAKAEKAALKKEFSESGLPSSEQKTIKKYNKTKAAFTNAQKKAQAAAEEKAANAALLLTQKQELAEHESVLNSSVQQVSDLTTQISNLNNQKNLADKSEHATLNDNLSKAKAELKAANKVKASNEKLVKNAKSKIKTTEAATSKLDAKLTIARNSAEQLEQSLKTSAQEVGSILKSIPEAQDRQTVLGVEIHDELFNGFDNGH